MGDGIRVSGVVGIGRENFGDWALCSYCWAHPVPSGLGCVEHVGLLVLFRV